MYTAGEKSIKKNFIYSTFYQILTLILPLFTAPYVSRVLGADGIGTYSYTASIQSYFSMIAALGALSYGQREISRSREDVHKRSQLFWEIEAMVAVTTGLTLLGWIGLVICYKKYSIYFLALTLNLVAVVFDISWFFSGLEEFKYIVIKNTIVKLATVALLFILIRKSSDLVLYIALMAGGTLLGNVSMWTKVPQFVIRIPVRSIRIEKHLKESLIYFVPTIATSVYTVLDKTLLGIITNDVYENGYYEQATKIINMAKAVAFASLNSVMGARTAYLFEKNRTEEVHRRVEDTLNYILLMGIGISFGIVGTAEGLVPWFFGEGYEPVVPLLKLFSPIIVIIGISNCLGSLYYTPIGKRALSAKFIILGSVSNLIFNLFFIPHFGAFGAAMGSLLAESIITVLYMAFCERYATVWMLIRLSWKRLLAAGVMILAIVPFYKVMQPSIALTVVQVIVGVAVYGCVLFLLRDAYLIRMWKQVIDKIFWRRKE